MHPSFSRYRNLSSNSSDRAMNFLTVRRYCHLEGLPFHEFPDRAMNSLTVRRYCHLEGLPFHEFPDRAMNSLTESIGSNRMRNSEIDGCHNNQDRC
jgi:hypothetical protein